LLNIDEKDLDKRVLRTRMALRTAFNTLMQQKPFEQITVLDITEEAMINRATFYSHFADKYELLDYMVRYMFNEHVMSIMPTADQMSYDNLRCLALATVTFLQQFIGHCAPSERNSTLPFEVHIQAYLFDLLSEWLDSSDAPANLVAVATSSAILNAGLFYARGNSALDREDYIDQLMAILMNGIRVNISDDILDKSNM